MKYPTVSALCEGVAEAIKEKEGSSALINPQDFVDRIKGLEVGGGGGIPDVPTLECWKITLPLDDMDPLYWLLSDIHDFPDYFIVVSEFDGNLYGGFGPMFGSGNTDYSANIFYVGILINGSTHFKENCLAAFREYTLDVYGEKISLSEFLSVISNASDYNI